MLGIERLFSPKSPPLKIFHQGLLVLIVRLLLLLSPLFTRGISGVGSILIPAPALLLLLIPERKTARVVHFHDQLGLPTTPPPVFSLLSGGRIRPPKEITLPCLSVAPLIKGRGRRVLLDPILEWVLQEGGGCASSRRQLSEVSLPTLSSLGGVVPVFGFWFDSSPSNVFYWAESRYFCGLCNIRFLLLLLLL